uniref:Trefoil factor 2-like n=1 Tax=Ciona intestinalis TaxID=7719 RepID=H2XY92_CIOIN|nr:trefoil factor 2-like [Ciona intestinalis]|eukprot:XP_004227073.1 trefoil factor 2-like [Ciona intestinalis]
MSKFVLLVVFLGMLCIAETAARDCDNGNPQQRKNCGWGGISKRECEHHQDCCFDESVPGVIWCFHNKVRCDRGYPHQRVNCGWAGISRAMCERNWDCCFDDSVSGVPFCYKHDRARQEE